MIRVSCALLAGVLALQCLPELPPGYCYAGAFGALLGLSWRPTRMFAIFLIGFLWALYRAQITLDAVLDENLEGRTVRVQGVVADIPSGTQGQAIRFPLHAERIDAGNGWEDFPRILRLGWYQTREWPALGERWQLSVRLKRPHGYANPSGFDYERWLFQRRISATGYVRKDAQNRLLGYHYRYCTDEFRQSVADYFDRDLPPSPGRAMIRALTIGDDGGIETAQWEVLRATGTTHLMVISGTHISLVAGLVFWVTRRLWSRLGRWPEMVPTDRAAGVMALLSATCYALLTGLGIPSQRALIMLAVAIAALLAGRWSRPGQVLALAVFATLVVDPLSVLASGWWLSFWAVSVIFFITAGRFGKAGWWSTMSRVHIVLTLGMLPLLLTFFQQASLVAPVANLVAVPWVSLLVVPSALLGTVLLAVNTTVGGWLLQLAAAMMDTLWSALHWLSQQDLVLFTQHQPSLWTLLPAVAGLLLLFTPRGFPGKWPGLILVLPLFTVSPPTPAFGDLWVTLLDVGQGLATVVRTRAHTLVYDAGPAYGPDFNTGQAVVVPFLRGQGVRHLDRLVVSHGDNDHIGGVPSLLKEYTVDRVEAGVPERLTMRWARQCRRGERWRWDGVEFSILHPDTLRYDKGNNASCVIRIETQNGTRVLLTGDIEAVAEQGLLQRSYDRLFADVLVVPHHGSLTSSSPAFVEAVRPQYALFATGYRNRYRFPHKIVIDRYRKSGAMLFDTAVHGAVTLRLNTEGRVSKVEPYRCDNRRYWRTLVCDPGTQYGCCDN